MPCGEGGTWPFTLLCLQLMFNEWGDAILNPFPPSKTSRHPQGPRSLCLPINDVGFGIT
jgi:hypothetical protein